VLNANSQQANLIGDISGNYTLLQKCYTEWASNFSKHEDVIRYLDKAGIKIGGIKKQSTFNLHSSHWNGITIPIIKKLVPSDVVKLRQQFDSLFDIKYSTDLQTIWYWLFFIHPVCHELYYFNDHYPLGYEARLSKLLRSHRMGLKAAKKYIGNKSSISSDESFIKACGTTAFKHLLLHPTTSRWKSSEGDILKRLQTLKVLGGDFSHDEMITASLLSRKGSLQFDQWLSYAPCAINEGPLFIIKKGLNPLEGFDSILKILSNDGVSQLKLRQCLQTFFNIKEHNKI
jgi:hypothetical protein